jgi:hypothetical protein
VIFGVSLVCPQTLSSIIFFFQDEIIFANVIPFNHETLNLFSPSNPPFEVKMWISMERKKQKCSLIKSYHMQLIIL